MYFILLVVMNFIICSLLLSSANRWLYRRGEGFTKSQIVGAAIILSLVLIVPLIGALQ